MTTTRLYISPLTPSLLGSILPASAPPSDFNTSLHSIETFPEKSYGYIDVSAEQAQKLKRKLNGSFLKGMKVRVEDARPEKRKRKAGDIAAMAAEDDGDNLTSNEQVQLPKRSKRDKNMQGILPAVELPDDRQVKRGWVEKGTDDKQNKHKKSKDGERKKDKKVDRSQMLFRAQLPPNVASKSTETDKKSKKKKKEKSERTKTAIEVKEFDKTTKYPTFLRDTKPASKSKTSSYVDGKGWVDQDGNVVEAENPSKKRKAIPIAPAVEEPATVAQAQLSESADSISSESSVVSSSSDSDDSSSEDVDDSAQSLEVTTSSSITSTSNVESSLAMSPTSKSQELSTPPPAASRPPTLEPAKEVHPLEALFKRPAPTSTIPSPSSPTNPTSTSTVALTRSTPRPAPIVTSFNFFDSDAADASVADADQLDAPEEDTASARLPQIPVTPFTQRDLEARGMRSAAPTPDTAAVGKRLRVPWLSGSLGKAQDVEDSDEDEEDDEDDDAEIHEDESEGDGHDTFAETREQQTAAIPTGTVGTEPAAEQTEFEKHFWANRGEYNRSWKARKREAKKEARQAENRRSGRLR